jgi:hypothetical protein
MTHQGFPTSIMVFPELDAPLDDDEEADDAPLEDDEEPDAPLEDEEESSPPAMVPEEDATLEDDRL